MNIRNILLILIVGLIIVGVFSGCATPKTEDEYFALAREALDKGDRESAFVHYKSVIEFYPQSEKCDDARLEILKILSTLVNSSEGDIRRAYLQELKDLGGAESDYIESKWANFELAKILEGEDPGKAEQYFGSITFPEYDNIARYLIGEGKYEDALLCYQKAAELYPHNPRIDKVKFMIPYIQGEHLGRIKEARKGFGNFANEFPKSELADDAAWMAENVGKPLDDLPLAESEE